MTNEEQKRDFLKLKEVLRLIPSGKFTPKQLGTLFQQYYEKHLKTAVLAPVPVSEVPADKYGDLDGNLPMFAQLDK